MQKRRSFLIFDKSLASLENMGFFLSGSQRERSFSILLSNMNSRVANAIKGRSKGNP
jgi:hypothetical protein